MLHSARVALYLAGALGALLGMTVVGLEIALVQPTVAKARVAIENAAAAESKPPAALLRVISRAHGDNIAPQVVRQLLPLPPSQLVGVQTTLRQLAESVLIQALPLHLSQEELTTVFLSQAHMGAGIRGFSQAAQAFLAADLNNVSLSQAARLVAISHAPSAILSNPQALAKRESWLLEALPE